MKLFNFATRKRAEFTSTPLMRSNIAGHDQCQKTFTPKSDVFTVNIDRLQGGIDVFRFVFPSAFWVQLLNFTDQRTGLFKRKLIDL